MHNIFEYASIELFTKRETMNLKNDVFNLSLLFWQLKLELWSKV